MLERISSVTFDDGTLKIKQRDEEKEPVKDESYKVLSDEKRRKTLERKNQEIR